MPGDISYLELLTSLLLLLPFHQVLLLRYWCHLLAEEITSGDLPSVGVSNSVPGGQFDFKPRKSRSETLQTSVFQLWLQLLA